MAEDFRNVLTVSCRPDCFTKSLEPALPDVTRRMMPRVIAPRMSDCQRLQDASDRLSGIRLEKKMKVIGHETIAEESHTLG